ncbi:MAG TPA: lipopolysaccharide biosynthesis protein [Drouetiella sp.]
MDEHAALEIEQSAKLSAELPGSDVLEDETLHTHRTNNALTFALAAQIGKFVLGLVAMIVFARTVSPEDFGVFSIGLVIFALGSLFKDGLSLAIVQRKSLDEAQKNSLYWTNILVGAVVVAITLTCAPLFSYFYKAPVLVPVLIGLAVAQSFVFLGSFHVTMMRRDMRFGILGLVEQVSTLIAMAIAIIVALNGGGIWSLLVAQVLTAVGTAIGAIWKGNYSPGKFEFHKDSLDTITYGKDVTISDVATYIVRNIDNLIIGLFCGTAQLGFYDRAYSIMQLPMVQMLGPIGGVAHSSLSKTVSSAQQYIQDARNAVSLYAVVGMSLAAYLFICANPLIPVVMGEQWSPSISILQALAPSIYVDSAIMGMCTLLLTNARTPEYLRLKLLAAVIGIASIFAGIKFGALGVAIAFSISRIPVVIYGLYLCDKVTPLKWQLFCRALRPAVIGSVVSSSILFGCTHMEVFQRLNRLQALVVYTVIFFGLFRFIWGRDPDGHERVLAFRRFLKKRLSRAAT